MMMIMKWDECSYYILTAACRFILRLSVKASKRKCFCVIPLDPVYFRPKLLSLFTSESESNVAEFITGPPNGPVLFCTRAFVVCRRL